MQYKITLYMYWLMEKERDGLWPTPTPVLRLRPAKKQVSLFLIICKENQRPGESREQSFCIIMSSANMHIMYPPKDQLHYQRNYILSFVDNENESVWAEPNNNTNNIRRCTAISIWVLWKDQTDDMLLDMQVQFLCRSMDWSTNILYNYVFKW